MTTTTKTVILKMLLVWGPTKMSDCKASVLGGSRFPEIVNAIRMFTSPQSAAMADTTRMYELIRANNEATPIPPSETENLYGT
jgi:hypothetical protein